MTHQKVSGCQGVTRHLLDQRPLPEEWERDPGRPLGGGKTPSSPKPAWEQMELAKR